MRAMKVTFIVIAMLLALCAIPVYAQVPLPHAFYGSLEIAIDGSPAPPPIHVKAEGAGVDVPIDFNPIITEDSGQYGGPAWNDPKLLVQGEIDPETVIEFYVSRDGVTWVKAETEPAPVHWVSGEISRVDLTATIAAPPEDGDGDGVGGGGGGITVRYIRTNLFGIEERYRIDSDGEIKETIEATSADGNLTIIIEDGTIALDEDGERLRSLEVAVDESPPDPPEDADIVLAYDLDPDGANFDPPITLTFSYDPADIPEGKDVLVVAYYDEIAEEWVYLEGEVDPATKTITVLVSHFTTFALIALAAPPPAPAAFSVTNLSVKPLEVELKEAVTITISVANTGGTAGSYSVVLMITGVKEAEKRITVAAGKSKGVSFSVAKEKAGSYSVVVDGLSASFTVVAPVPEEEVAPPEEEEVVVPEAPAEEEEVVVPAINWPVLGGIIATKSMGTSTPAPSAFT